MKLKKFDKIQKYQLRNKIEKILSRTNLQPCIPYQNNLNLLNNKINHYYEADYYKNQKINNSLSFSYAMNNRNEEEKKKKFIDYQTENIIDLPKENDYVIKLLFNELTFEEIKIILQNPEFYIRNNSIRNNLDFFHQKHRLYETLNLEENHINEESEDRKLSKMIRNKKNEIIYRINHPNEDVESIKNKEEIEKEIKKDIKFQKINYQKNKIRNERNDITLNNIFLNSQKEIQRKIHLSNDFKEYLLKEKIKKRNIENITKLGNNIDHNSEIIVKPFPLNQSINIKKHISQKSKIFPTIPSPKPSQKLNEVNVRLKQLKKKMLEKETQNMINMYISEIKESFSYREKNNDYLPLITN